MPRESQSRPSLLSAGLVVLIVACLVGCTGTDASEPENVEHEFTTTTLEGQPMTGDGPENPAALGVAMSVGGWNVAVIEREVQAESQSGSWVAVSMTATYIQRPGAGHFFDDVGISALDSTGAKHELTQEGCRDGLEHTEPVEPGQVVEGNLCFDISGEVPGLQLVVTALGQPTAHVVYLATE